MMKKVSKLLILSSPFVFILIIFGGMSYAYMQYTQSFASTNSMKTSCYSFETVEEYSDVTISNGIPVSDEDGLLSEPYRMKITNKCTTAMTVQAVMNVQSSSTMSDSYVKAALDTQVHSLTSANRITTSLPSGTRSAYTIGSIVLAPKETKEVMVRAWISGDVVDGQAENATFVGKVTFNFEQSTIGALIINDSNLKTTTPDFANYPDEANTGLFKAEDDEGTSYYFRGNIDNNYVDIGTTYSENVGIYVVGINGSKNILAYKTYNEAVQDCDFYYDYQYGYASSEACIADIQDQSVHIGDKMLWRIVRINGDGSVRLISDNIVSRKEFNSTYDNHKYVGYTYDNSAFNVQDGTSSTIKTYLDSWYTTNIANKGLDSIIQTSTYCNDTSISSTSGNDIYYGANNRVNNNSPQLICNQTDQTYGGKYALKVGLLSVDELLMAGYNYSEYASQKTYIWNLNWFWTGSPISSYVSMGDIFGGSFDGSIGGDRTYNANGVRPVINLKANLSISSGDGTKDKPYVVRVS